MEKDDARTLSPEAQEQLRKQAIRFKKQGKKFKEIAEIVGVHRGTVSSWWHKYEMEGAVGLKAKKRGRREGACRTLSSTPADKIQRFICDKTPDQLKLTFALWTR
ncbi:MAG: transposase, partial [Nitrospiria bacterium]